MSRRRGQTGHIEKNGRWWTVRYWKDVPGQGQRVNMREKICPISGPGKLTASERQRKAREIIEASGADKAETLAASIASVTGLTFRQQAEEWMAKMRKQGVAPSTLINWQSHLDKWVLPGIGDLPLSYIKKTTTQALIDTMLNKLAPKSIKNIFQVVQMVFSSATNEDGEEIHPRNWRKMGLVFPKVKKSKQRRPCFTSPVIDYLAGSPTIKRTMRMLFIFCGATGLRIGEALGIRIEHILDTGTRMIIKEKAWNGQIHEFLKTDNGEREIDLHPAASKLLLEYIGERKSGLLFCSSTGKQLWQSNILRRHLHPALKRVGFPKSGNHAFRRFRDTHLRNFTHCPMGIINFWLGWGSEGMSEHYDAIKHDVAKRKAEAEAAGLGFNIPSTLGSDRRVPRRKRAIVIPIEPKIETVVEQKRVVNA